MNSNWFRYIFATIGPVGMAASQFLLTLAMLQKMSPSDFGTFSFLLLMLQLSFGVSNALFCAPLPVLIANKNTASGSNDIQSLFGVGLLFVLAMGLLFAFLGQLLGLTPVSMSLFALYVVVALIRWFARAYAYAVEAPSKTIVSDIVYSITLFFCLAGLMITIRPLVESAYACLLVSAIVGLLPFGWRQIRRQFTLPSLAALSNYRGIWVVHSGWSLLGVITTEATVNAHAYIVTLFSGPAVFAGLAASALVIRPTVVLVNALSEFERPHMARYIAQGQRELVFKLASTFRVFLIVGWIVSVLLAILLFKFWPELLVPKQYEVGFIKTGAALWLAVAAIRILRSPESTMLQAAGMFRRLAYASVISSVFSVFAVIGFMLVANPLWSIGGVICGEVVMTIWIWLQTGRWKKS